jgi:hypothetical protein
MTLRDRIYRLLQENGPTTVRDMSMALRHPEKALRSTVGKMAELHMVRRKSDSSHLWLAGPVEPQNNNREIMQAKAAMEFARSRARRDHDARAKDIDRDKLAADVKAWVKAGNRIKKLPSYTEAAPANRASAREPIGGGW